MKICNGAENDSTHREVYGLVNDDAPIAQSYNVKIAFNLYE